MTRLSLVADIGGTNTRVALAEGLQIQKSTIRRFHNTNQAGLAEVLRIYLTDEENPLLSGACVAVAGPVHDNTAKLTNLDWVIDAATLKEASGASHVAVLNDLQAQGHALGQIPHAQITSLIEGPSPPAGSARLVIGIGTGFNAAPVHENMQGRIVLPSECGHITLPVRDDAGLRLSRFITRAHGYPEIEEVLSGRGLETLHAFVSEEAGTSRRLSSAEIATSLADDTRNDPFVTQTGRHFARVLGMVCGDLALTHLPFGGIYLCGGVTRSIAPHLIRLGLSEAFRDKGRFSPLMRKFAISVIEDDYAALTGCAAYLSRINGNARPSA
ncbi:MAG: glucokinase [Pseudorhodobacter sp.]